MNKNYISNYIKNLSNNLLDHDANKILKTANIFKSLNKNNKLIFAGNGGSSAMASHVSVDFTKTSNIRAINFNEYNLITCFGNDFGYENWISKSLEYYSIKGDIVILISSSGNSKNMINAAKYCKKKGLKLITFTGFNGKNKLSKLGNINFTVDSINYNHIEMTHHIWLLCIVDLVINASY